MTPERIAENVLAWGADGIEESTIAQAETMARLPFVAKPLALMPDAHVGIGATVGSVVFMTGAIVPSAVGVDIGCLDRDTEFLSPQGWKKISEWSGEEVLSYEMSSDKAGFVTPLRYIVQDCAIFYHFKNSRGMDQMLSEEHRVPVWMGAKSRGYQVVVMHPGDLEKKRSLDSGYYNTKTVFRSANDELAISDDMIRVEVMVQADGRVRPSRLSNYVELHFRRERKIERARKLLAGAGIEYSEKIWSDGSTAISFRIERGYCDKNLARYWRANARQLAIVAEESLKWDGHEGYRSYYSTTDQASADLIQYAFAGSGTRAGIHSRRDDRSSHWKDMFSVIPTRNEMVGFCAPTLVPSPDGKKYCFTVETGFFVARREGKIFITGNCGMIAARSSLKASHLPDNLDRLLSLIESRIPAGVGKGHEACRELPVEIGLPPSPIGPGDEKKVAQQFGTLGSGNHFVELCIDEAGWVWLVLHSGSRGIGNQLAQRHMGKAKKLMKRYFIELDDPDLAYFAQSTPEFDDYLADMFWAQQYAAASRDAMMTAAFESLREICPGTIEMERINCHHNFAAAERHHGRDGWVIRKGAIRARTGDRGIIPGSMGTASYIVTGLGNKASYESCSHGAGRRMSRSKARKELTVESFIEHMDNKIWQEADAKALLDEHPLSYKDIETVMEAQADLVKVDHRLTQILNYKGVR